METKKNPKKMISKKKKFNAFYYDTKKKNEEVIDQSSQIASNNNKEQSNINQEAVSTYESVDEEFKAKNSVVVSVKNLVDTTEMDELTKLFRKMIGIDKSQSTSTIVRQFSCSKCYRAWWRRVRLNKQVSACIKCNKKYVPLPYNKEFGIGEFHCECSNKFYEWCSKESSSVCRKCNNLCKPLRISINTKLSRQTKTIVNDTNNCKKNSLNSSNSTHSSNNSLPCQSTNPRSSSGLYRQWNQLPKRNGKYFCSKCNDTNIDMNSGLVIRPQNYLYDNYGQSNLSNSTSISFCKYCRKIPAFSVAHVSTGSTLESISYQGDLDLRFLDDEIDCMEPCIEQSSEDETK